MANGSTLYLIQEEQAAHIQRCFQDLQLQACCSEAVNAVAAAARALSLKVQGLLCAEQIFQGYRPMLLFLFIVLQPHTLEILWLHLVRLS